MYLTASHMSRLYDIQQGQDIAAGARGDMEAALPRRARGLYLRPAVPCRYRACLSKAIRGHPSRTGEDGTNYRRRIIPFLLLCRRNMRVASQLSTGI